MKKVERDVVLEELKDRYIISKEDFEKIFHSKKIICRKEYEEYLKMKKFNSA